MLMMAWCTVQTSIDCTREHDFDPWKVYCASNVPFHAEFKYAIKSFPSPLDYVQWLFYYWFFGILGIFSVILLHVNQYFKWFSTVGGLKQFTIIKSLAVCAQKQEVMKQTLSHGAGHSAESYRVTLPKYASTAQTFTVCTQWSFTLSTV